MGRQALAGRSGSKSFRQPPSSCLPAAASPSLVTSTLLAARLKSNRNLPAADRAAQAARCRPSPAAAPATEWQQATAAGCTAWHSSQAGRSTAHRGEAGKLEAHAMAGPHPLAPRRRQAAGCQRSAAPLPGTRARMRGCRAAARPACTAAPSERSPAWPAPWPRSPGQKPAAWPARRPGNAPCTPAASAGGGPHRQRGRCSQRL